MSMVSMSMILISYAFLCFTAWLENVKSLSGSEYVFKYQPAGHVEIYCVLIETTNQVNFRSFSPDD